MRSGCVGPCFSHLIVYHLSVSVTLTLSSVHPSIYPSSCLSLPICLYLIYPSTHLPFCLPICLYICRLPVYLTIFLSIHLSIYPLSVHPPIYPSAYFAICILMVSCNILLYDKLHPIVILMLTSFLIWAVGPLQEVCCVLCHMCKVHLI